MPSFSKGMVVQLVSGGPKMSVSEVSDYSFSAGIEDGVKCVWFDEKGHQQERIFDAAVLQEWVKPPTSGTITRS
jgi:uncharacterized protein YodC (DUF2158 family)